MIARGCKKCKQCRVAFTDEERARHQRIHSECIAAFLNAQADKKMKARLKKERAEDKIRREKLQTLAELKKAAQKSFNAFIRARDREAGHPCISSGRPLDWSGNQVDAGHFRSVGAAPHLRFNEYNVHAQSKHDNQWKAGNVVEYRINLIKRIGQAAVEYLEGSNEVHRWTREELRTIKATYDFRLKQLKLEEA